MTTLKDFLLQVIQNFLNMAADHTRISEERLADERDISRRV